MAAQNDTPALQTLSRGIRVLEHLADVRGSSTIDETAAALGVHRSIAYRLVRTLEQHGLVARDESGRITLGSRMAALAAGVAHDVQAEALPELTAIANELGMTCFLATLDRDECVTLVSVEPRHAVAAVAQRPGTRHSVAVGAPGKAILSAVPTSDWPDGVSDATRAEVKQVAEAGFATSHDEVIPSLRSVAVPLSVRGRAPAALAVVYVVSAHGDAEIGRRLVTSADAIRHALGG
ncbi:ArsR family transcriptional regulator [Labedella phragmitis]|uniref:ArsR family transcriptional regulator n=1 Tax=Labedella phragmitis TaxID=2498849 RepID=A0A3S4DJ35_9MICO|nr:helix-turn-helix domain-containing protein [Labedella phragmitis]RWZ52679.1 ArsR family transcriptional regulator [Labedella phragmitis]